MIKSILSTMACALWVVTAHADVPPPKSDPQNKGGWVLNQELSDEFNGSSFDRNVWYNLGENGNYRGQWKGRAPSQYNPNNISVREGKLFLKSRWQPNFNFADEVPSGNPTSSIRYGEIAPVTTAALLSKKTFKYGYMEMRSKAANGPISSSYWTTGPGGETDAFESFGWNPNNRWSAKRFHTSFHDWRNNSNTYGKRIWENDHIFDFNVTEGFHTYGFEWDPNYIAIYIDGAMVNCVTKTELGNKWVAYSQHKVWIDSEIFDWEVKPQDIRRSHFGANGIDFVVDYARVYQHRPGARGAGCPNRENLVKNPGFENGKTNWTGDGVVNNQRFKGSKGLTLSSSGTVQQVVNVKPNTTYLLSAVVTSPQTNERDIWNNAYLGVKNYGGQVQDTRYFFPRWHKKSLQFKTGANNTKATIYFTNAPQGAIARIDEVLLTEMKVRSSDGNSGGNNGEVTPPNGNISLQNKHSLKCLDLEKGSSSNGTNIAQWGCSASNTHQDFKFVSKGNRWYQIRTKHNKCLGVAGAGTKNGTNIVQWNCSDSNDQQFRLVNKGNNWFELRARHSNKCAAIAGNSKENEGNVLQWNCNSHDSQRFRFKN